MGIAMGRMITVAAVLEVHMDKNTVASIKPRMIFITLVPIIFMMD
jgi:hypothetical protein